MTQANLVLNYTDTLVLDRTKVCCPPFDPSAWDYTQHDWQKLFLKYSVLKIFSAPLPWTCGKTIDNLLKKAEEAKATPRNGNPLVLTRKVSTFKSEIFIEVSKAVPNQEIVRLSGTFISRVFEEHEIPTCKKGLDGYMTSLGKVASEYYFHYPYCPSCAIKHGHRYLVAIAKTKTMDPYLQVYLDYKSAKVSRF